MIERDDQTTSSGDSEPLVVKVHDYISVKPDEESEFVAMVTSIWSDPDVKNGRIQLSVAQYYK